jgi:hypothetical protein
MAKVTFTEVSPHRFRTTAAAAVPTWMQDAPDLRLVDIPRALASGGLTAAQRGEAQFAHAKIVKYLDAYGAVRAGLHIA